MSIKSNYFKMDEKEFESYLSEQKKLSNTIHLLNNKYFYVQTLDTSNLILDLNKKIVEFDLIINSFSNFARKQIIQSFLLDEIEATNKIENIFSTKHDILSVISNISTSKDKKIVSIANAYKHLLESKGNSISSISNIRELYDIILKGAILEKDLPDGTYFRKDLVYVSDGFKPIHSGTLGEENINQEMNNFVELYNSKNEIITKMVLCHFIFENVHPFYDGNGRLGRYLFSNGLFLETGSFFSFAISSSIEHEKQKYYKAFKEANDKYEFGCLNVFVELIVQILVNQINNLIKTLKDKKEVISNLKTNIKLTKNEKKVYDLISEASILSNFGVSNDEIMNETKVSKRSLIYVLNKLREDNILEETKIGRITYHKIKN